MTPLQAGRANVFDRAERGILSVLPARAGDLARLRVLALEGRWPIVTVIGKYNHGKSRLLNELIGDDVFRVADRRETVALADHVHEGVRWLDAPGLDADAQAGDDNEAHRAAWQRADVRLFVHAAREGELDAAERALLQALHDDQARTHRQTLFVLTQVDQTADAAQLTRVTDAIAGQAAAQMPGLTVQQASSTRHRQGIEGGKALLVERSGIPALQAMLRAALARVPRARAHERALRLADLQTELRSLQEAQAGQLRLLQETASQQRRAFEDGLAAVLARVEEDLQPVLQVTGTDPALVPDSFQTMFRLTAGKQARSRIQIACSRACIAINAVLVRHGVAGLPPVQQTSVRSLDTVMVAVMGVSVKYRDDLRRIFCEPAGRARLAREFAHYFEVSDDRQALVRRTGQAEAALAATTAAVAALATLRALAAA